MAVTAIECVEKSSKSAGRHASFSEAAKELHVTPGAVSRQVKLLEDFLGVAVFERNSREIKLTEESRAYIRALSDAFERVDSATKRFLHARRERPAAYPVLDDVHAALAGAAPDTVPCHLSRRARSGSRPPWRR